MKRTQAVKFGEKTVYFYNPDSPPQGLTNEALAVPIRNFRASQPLASIEILDVKEPLVLYRRYVGTDAHHAFQERGRGFTTHMTHFLGGMDERSRFNTALEERVTTIDAAILSLMPDEIWYMTIKGKEAKRQGDFFFVDLTSDFHPNEMEFRIAKQAKMLMLSGLGDGGRRQHIPEAVWLGHINERRFFTEGEEHLPSEMPAHLAPLIQAGRWLEGHHLAVRGIVTHPEHSPLVLDTWHLVVPNHRLSTRPSVD